MRLVPDIPASPAPSPAELECAGLVQYISYSWSSVEKEPLMRFYISSRGLLDSKLNKEIPILRWH